MLLDLALLLSAASLATGASIPRQDPDILSARQDSGDPGLQDIPTTAKPDNTFSNGAAMIAGSGTTNETPPEVYGNRTIDLPFGRLYVCNFGVLLLLFNHIWSLETGRPSVYSADISRSSVSHHDQTILTSKSLSSMAT